MSATLGFSDENKGRDKAEVSEMDCCMACCVDNCERCLFQLASLRSLLHEDLKFVHTFPRLCGKRAT